MWKPNEDGGRVSLLVGEESNHVKSLREGKHLMEIDFLLVSMTIVTLNLKDYNVEGSGSSPSGRRKFVSLWKTHFLPCEWPDKTQNNDRTSSADELVDRSANVLTDMGPSGKNVEEKSTDNSIAGSQDILLKEQYRGTHLVHIRNLIAPKADHRSRVIDMDHVSQLVRSFREEDIGQLVILVGLIDRDVDPLSLKEVGAGQVECLGGNHTREALLTLLEEGTLKFSHVQVRLYSNLSREAALSIGFAHNHITHEKRKCVTFMDKVRLMRDLLPDVYEQVPANLRVWKSALALIFKKKDGRQLQRQYSHHLLIARLPSSVWETLLQAVQGLEVTERLFRPVMRLKEDYLEDVFKTLNKGVPHFKRELRTMLSDHKKLKKPPKETPQQKDTDGDFTVDTHLYTVDEEQQWKNNDLNEDHEVGDDVTSLKNEIDRLKALNKTLTKENKELKVEQCKLQKKLQEVASLPIKRKCARTLDVTPKKKAKEDFFAKQKVWAKFKDGVFYPAMILEVNNSGFKVRWLEDNIEGCLKADDLKPYSSRQ